MAAKKASKAFQMQSEHWLRILFIVVILVAAILLSVWLTGSFQ